MKPKLSILIATVGQREERFLNLIEELLKQAHQHEGEVEILVYWNNGELPMGEIRQKLVEEATGDYICFVDDDDRVPEYYVEAILDAIKDNVDYVGWQMQLYTNGEPAKPTYHSLVYDSWHEDDNGYYRDVSHLNPIRHAIALKVSFETPTGSPEDFIWTKRIAPYLKTEAYIDKIMYFYQHSPSDSIWNGKLEHGKRYIRPSIVDPNFRYHPSSKEAAEL